MWGQLDEASMMIMTDLKTMWHMRLGRTAGAALLQGCSRPPMHTHRCGDAVMATALAANTACIGNETDISVKPCKSIEENVEGCAAATRNEALYSRGHANSAHKHLLLAKSSTRRQKSKGRQSAGGVSSVSTSSTREA